MLHLPDLDLPKTSLVVLVQVDVDGEMGIDVSHLVLETLCHTDDQVVDQRSDGAESGDILASTVMQFDINDIFLGMREVDCQMAEVLGKLAFKVC